MRKRFEPSELVNYFYQSKKGNDVREHGLVIANLEEERVMVLWPDQSLLEHHSGYLLRVQ